jgi:hypothetical protein
MPKSSLNVNEEKIERYLCDRVKALGGVAEKVTVLGARGFFDRLVVLPGGRVIFCECKKPRGSHTAVHQKIRHDSYRALGAEVVVLKSFAGVDLLLS